VVIVPDIGSFALYTVIGRNQAYVAISRPKHGLILGCSDEFVARPTIETLEKNNLICVRDIPAH
jgi:ATP-dependent exoDNAse (exonuclease V) alpha subunit